MKVTLRQFDPNLNEMSMISQEDSERKQESGFQGMYLLVSKHIGLRTLQTHIQTISMNLLTDVTTASKCTIILVNPAEENEF
jgi:hypothetical protein